MEDLPAAHCEHELVTLKELTLGPDMKEPAGQQPWRAVLDPRFANALLSPVIDSHAPPHNVRVNPLLKNMDLIVVTSNVSHLEISPLNAVA